MSQKISINELFDPDTAEAFLALGACKDHPVDIHEQLETARSALNHRLSIRRVRRSVDFEKADKLRSEWQTVCTILKEQMAQDATDSREDDRLRHAAQFALLLSAGVSLGVEGCSYRYREKITNALELIDQFESLVIERELSDLVQRPADGRPMLHAVH